MPGELHEIVLTGGPCGGKTTGINYIEEKLKDKGYRVFTVPEVATRLFDPGMPDIVEIAQTQPEKYFEIQRFILDENVHERKEITSLVNKIFSDEKVVIIYDRGPMDGLAYIEPALFHLLLNEQKVSLVDARDPYEGVFHLVTAAKGAEEFYTLSNNKARKEPPELAIKLDQLTQQAWTGTPHLKVIDNSTDFEQKIKRLEKAIYRVIGIPVPLEIENKYLVEVDQKNLPPFQVIDIEQIYLIPKDGKELRIRQRGQNGSSLYYLTHKTTLRPGVRAETEEKIDEREYLKLKQLHDPERDIIKKSRSCFVYDSQYFELDTFIEPKRLAGLSLLEIELTEENDIVKLPPGITLIKDVTEDKRYSNRNLAQRSR